MAACSNTCRCSTTTLGRPLITTLIAQTRSMGTYKASTLIDFERGFALELESLFHLPLRLAREAGVPVPRLAALCSVLAALNPRLPE